MYLKVGKFSLKLSPACLVTLGKGLKWLVEQMLIFLQ